MWYSYQNSNGLAGDWRFRAGFLGKISNGAATGAAVRAGLRTVDMFAVRTKVGVYFDCLQHDR